MKWWKNSTAGNSVKQAFVSHAGLRSGTNFHWFNPQPYIETAGSHKYDFHLASASSVQLLTLQLVLNAPTLRGMARLS